MLSIILCTLLGVGAGWAQPANQIIPMNDIIPMEKIVIRKIVTMEESNTEDRIIQGIKLSNTGLFPHQCMVTLDLGGGRISLCGGALVSRTQVLTAAHCVNTGSNLPVTVTCGVGSSQEQRISGRSTSIPSWNGNINNGGDIAIVTVNTPFVLSLFVYPATINTNAGEVPAGPVVYISGYGAVGFDADGKKISANNVLSYAQNKIKSYADQFRDHQQEFVGVEANPNPGSGTRPQAAVCSGDSGGPLSLYQGQKTIVGIGTVHTWRVMGVTSFGYAGPDGLDQCGGDGPGGAGATDLKSYYSRTAYKPFLDFITSHFPPANGQTDQYSINAPIYKPAL